MGNDSVRFVQLAKIRKKTLPLNEITTKDYGYQTDT